MYLPRYLDVRLESPELRQAMSELFQKLLAQGAVTRNGKKVCTVSDAARWLLERELLDKQPELDPAAQIRLAQAKLRSA